MTEARTYKNVPCAERTGFLFAHQCGMLADSACELCGKLICARHTDYSPQGQRCCITCARRDPNDPNHQTDESGTTVDSSGPSTTDDSTPPDRDRRSWSPSSRDDSPYWYSTTYYPYGSRTSSNDFNDADEASLKDNGQQDEAMWEREMGAS
ncbi:MAG: hypothetical protein U0795_22070 [Pirellulales bacterium]